MSVTVKSVGDFVTITSADPSPAAANGPAAGDRSLMFVAVKPITATVTTPANWTLVAGPIDGGTGTTGPDTGPIRIYVYSRDDAFSGAQAVTTSGDNSGYGIILTFSKTLGAWSTLATTTGDDTTGGSDAYSATCAANPGWTAGDAVVAGIALPTDASTLTVQGALSSPSVAATGISSGTTGSRYGESSTGDDFGAGLIYRDGVTGTASDAPVVAATFTDATNTYGPTILVRLRDYPVIAYGSAGAGAGTETNGASLDLVCPATVNANDILIAHVTYEGTTTGPTTPSGWTELFGPAPLGTGTPVGRSWVFGKVASGSEDGSTVGFGTAGGTAGRYGRIYSFTGYSSGTIDQICVGFTTLSDETSTRMPPVRTYATGALAVALLVQDDNNTFAAAGAVTGGTWAEPVAEFVSTTLGAQGCIVGIQTSSTTGDPGMITGGTANTATADEACSIGLAIHAAPPTGMHMVSSARFQDYSVTSTPRDTNEVMHWLTGDLVIAIGQTGGEATDLNTPTATGLTFSLEGETGDPGGSNADTYIWTEVAASAGADNLTGSVASVVGGYGFAAVIIRNHGGVGTFAGDSNTNQSFSYTRSAADSGVLFGMADFDADPVTGVALTPTDGLPVLMEEFGTSQTDYIGVWFNQGAAGSTTYGTTGAPASTNLAKAAIEILAAAGEFEGDATLAVTSAITATGNMDAAGSSTLAVTDSITASGQGTGTSSLAVTAGRTASGQGTGTASLAETATITATGNMSATGSSTLSVTDSITASGQAAGTSSLAVTADRTASGQAQGTSTLAVTSTITATGSLQSDASATLAVTAAITATGVLTTSGSASLAVTDAITTSGRGEGTASLGVTDSITTTGRTQGTSSLAATAAITASGALVFSGTASLTVTAGRTASGLAQGTTTLAVTANRTVNGRTEATAALAATATITASGALVFSGTAALSVAVEFTVLAQPPVNVVVTVTTGPQRYLAGTGSGRYAAATGSQRHTVTTGET